MLKHTLSGYGNATDVKIIEVSYGRNGYLYSSTAVSDVYQKNLSLGDNSVTPSAVGFLGDGTTYYYDGYATKTIDGTVTYSTARSGSITLPNDSLYYIIDIAYASVSGATYKLRRKIGAGGYAYKTNATTSLSDDTAVSWAASSTLTPTQALGATEILDYASSDGTRPVLKMRNRTNSFTGYLDFQKNSGGGVWEMGARYGMYTTGNAFIDSYNHGLEIGTLGTPHIELLATNTRFNKQSSSSFRFLISGATVSYLMYAQCAENTVYFGTSSSASGSDPLTTIYVSPTNTTDKAIILNRYAGASDTNSIFEVKDGATVLTGITNSGYGFFNATGNNSSNLYIGSGSTNRTQLRLADCSSSIPASPLSGGIEYSFGYFYGTDSSAQRKRFQQSLATSTNTYYWRSDANGNAQADNTLYVQSGVILNAGLLVL